MRPARRSLFFAIATLLLAACRQSAPGDVAADNAALASASEGDPTP